MFEGKNGLTPETIKKFYEDFAANKIKPFLKS